VEAVLLVADVLDRLARDVLDHGDGHGLGSVGIFTGDHHALRRRHGLAGGADGPRVEAGAEALAVKRIDDFIRDAVADLVGVALGNRLAGE
jgi:hypothetical protein